jgi:hypothetical protein
VSELLVVRYFKSLRKAGREQEVSGRWNKKIQRIIKMINLFPAGFEMLAVFVPGNLSWRARADTLTNDLNLLQSRHGLITPQQSNLQRTN